MVFETDRLLVRQWTLDDIEQAMKLWGDPKVTGLITATGLLTPDQVTEKLDEQIELQKKFGVQYWAAIDKNTGKIIGCCGLRPYDLKNHVYEIGFHIMSDYWGQGFATEAALGVVNYARNKMQIIKLFAGHNPKNLASCKVLEKIGFKYIRDEFYKPTGLMHPSYELKTID